MQLGAFIFAPLNYNSSVLYEFCIATILFVLSQSSFLLTDASYTSKSIFFNLSFFFILGITYRNNLLSRSLQGLQNVLDQEMMKYWDDLYNLTDNYTDGWLSSGTISLRIGY